MDHEAHSELCREYGDYFQSFSDSCRAASVAAHAVWETYEPLAFPPEHQETQRRLCELAASTREAAMTASNKLASLSALMNQIGCDEI